MKGNSRKEHGFTLIELLVVILIISILAAIAIPVFMAQREKAWNSQSQSALKSAATAVESYATENGGNFAGLAGDDGTLLANHGYSNQANVVLLVSVAPSETEYCVTATHTILPAGPEPNWQVATYNSSDGSPSPSNVDAC